VHECGVSITFGMLNSADLTRDSVSEIDNANFTLGISRVNTSAVRYLTKADANGASYLEEKWIVYSERRSKCQSYNGLKGWSSCETGEASGDKLHQSLNEIFNLCGHGSKLFMAPQRD
jgi:hypothetical protein